MKLRYRPKVPALCFAAVFVLAGCSGGGARLYQREVGLATRNDLERVASYLILRFHYQLSDYDSTPFLRWETQWRPRALFRDERELGITAAENRLTVIGRSRLESEVTTYTTRVTVENRVRVAGSGTWIETVSTPLFRAYADSISEQFRRELRNIGFRRH